MLCEWCRKNEIDGQVSSIGVQRSSGLLGLGTKLEKWGYFCSPACANDAQRAYERSGLGIERFCRQQNISQR